MQDVLVNEQELRQLVAARLSNAGLNQDHAAIVADVLVHADLRGVRSHGVMRTEHYVKRLNMGSINKTPTFSFSKLRAAAGQLDADDGMGHPACLEAMHHSCELAAENGIGIVGVVNGSHCGALSYFVHEAVKKGMLGMAVTHTDKCVAPFGGAKPFFGTNPIAFGFPTEKHDPVILDLATSNTAYGKVLHAREENKEIPADWGLDEDGKPTTDPNAVRALLPFGAHKGYGIGLVIDVLTGVLLGGEFGPHITAMYGDYDKPRKLCSTMIAIDPNCFAGLANFTSQMDRMVDELHGQQPAEGFSKVLVPGEPEWLNEKRNREHGVPVLSAIYDYLKG